MNISKSAKYFTELVFFFKAFPFWMYKTAAPAIEKFKTLKIRKAKVPMASELDGG